MVEPTEGTAGDDAPAGEVDRSREGGRIAGMQERLEWLMLFRIVLVTLLLGSAIAVNIGDVARFGAPSYVAIATLIVVAYLASIAHVIALRAKVDLVRLAHAQIIGDVTLVFGLVLLTEGVESVFSFLFFLTIFNGAVLLRRAGAIFAASGTSVALAAVALLQFSELPWLIETFPSIEPRSLQVPVYGMMVHIVGFYTVALLSGYLAEQLGRVGTELERRQVDLRELRALTENVVRSAGSGLVALDPNDRLLFGNPAAQRILGLDLAPHTGVELGAFSPDLARLAREVGVQTEPTDVQWKIPGAARLRALSLQRSPLVDAEGASRGSILVLQDQTEVRDLQAQLARQAHLAAIGNLSAAIAHEIRNPLASISGSVELLRGEVDHESSASMLVEIVLREVDRLNKLVSDFLDYARPQSVTMREVDVLELVESTVRAFLQDHTIVGEDLELEIIDALGAQRTAWMDGDRIRQVLWNLLRNAAEANGRAGRVEVGLSQGCDRAPRTCVVSVSDDGKGFSEAAREQLFEPFFTTKEGGTGLGLATCHRIVQAHGGALRADNRPEGGAMLTMVLLTSASIDPGRLSDVRVGEDRTCAMERIGAALPSERRTRRR